MTTQELKAIPDAPYRIHPSLAHLARPISELTPWPGNPRRGDVDGLRESLRVFGQLKAVIVQASTGWICAGNHLTRAAGERGWEEVAVVEADLTDDMALRYLLLDNKAADAGTYNKGELAEHLTQLQRSGHGLGGTGYHDDEVSRLLEELASQYDGTGLDDADSGAGGEPDTPVIVNWDLVVRCTTEAHRERLLRRLTDEGLDARAV